MLVKRKPKKKIMYILILRYFKSSESKHPDEIFDLSFSKGNALDFAKLYNLKEEVFCGEIDYSRKTNIEEVNKWLKDGVISVACYHSKKFSETDLSNPSSILEISASYWQSGY